MAKGSRCSATSANKCRGAPRCHEAEGPMRWGKVAPALWSPSPRYAKEVCESAPNSWPRLAWSTTPHLSRRPSSSRTSLIPRPLQKYRFRCVAPQVRVGPHTTEHVHSEFGQIGSWRQAHRVCSGTGSGAARRADVVPKGGLPNRLITDTA